jgi:DNA gyrase/topoisomerase IV subunit B
LVNAADNKQRDSTMDSLKVTIDQEQGTISVYNNGRGIPIEMHAKEKIYVPELIFGHLLTSSNYNDKEKKVRAVVPCGHSVCSARFTCKTAHNLLCRSTSVHPLPHDVCKPPSSRPSPPTR